MTQQDSPVRTKGTDEKFCSECGEIIRSKAEICPKCGVRQTFSENVSKAALLLFTFFLGGFGAHKFYVGKNWQGLFYLLFCWTGIPGLISLVEFLVYAFTPSEKLQQKYTASGNGLIIVGVVVGGFFLAAIMGILAAIAIPQFVAYRDRANQVAVETELRNFAQAEEIYYSRFGRYSENIQEMNFTYSVEGVTIDIMRADESCYEASGKHEYSENILQIDCNTYRQ